MTHDTRDVKEITTPVSIEQEHERFSSLFASLVRNSSDIITVLDAEGRFRFISDSLTDVLGWRPEELIGQLSFPFIHPDDRDGGLAALGRVMTNPGQLVTHRYRLLHRDGRYVPIEGRATNLLADPFVQGVLINSRDITHRLEEEEVLRRAQAALEQEVENRTAEIRAANLLLQREIEERRQVEGHLRQRLAEAVALERISRIFITHSPPDFQAVLQQLGEAMQVSRVFLHMLREGVTIESAYEWRLRPEDDHHLFGKGTRISEFRAAYERFCRNEVFSIPDADKLPPEAVVERDLARILHARSALMVPILAKESTPWGVIGLERFDQPHEWSPEEERLVRVVSEIIVHYDTARRAEMALRESEESFRIMFENAAIGMVIGDLNGCLISCNKALEDMTGYSLAEMKGFSYLEITHSEDYNRSRDVFEGAKASPGRRYQIEKRYIRKDGRTIWVSVTASIIHDTEGKPRRVFGMLEDVTQEREAKQQVLAYQERLRSLASQLSQAEEQQRRQIAAELHDRIGQALAMLKIKLGVCREPAIQAGMEADLEDLQAMLDQIIADTRFLIFEISPPVLYELGFVPAVEWLTEQMSERHGLKITVEDDHLPKVMNEHVRVLLFQAVRELLVNVIKHARAGCAAVAIRREGDWVRVTVSDDGIGFDPAAVRSSTGKQGGFGLFNIQERLASIGGNLEIEDPGAQGTRIALRAPLPRPRRRRKGQ